MSHWWTVGARRGTMAGIVVDLLEAPSKAQMLENRLRKKARHLARWAKRTGVSCYRLYDRDIPEVPLVIDWYEGRLHLVELDRPSAEPLSPKQSRALSRSFVEAAAQALSIDPAHVFAKRRERTRGGTRRPAPRATAGRLVVHEGGHRFWVDLASHVDAGLFLDHRLTRARVGMESRGKDVLNLFSYTGAFTVYAAKGGARTTTSVDMSNTYLAWARSNLELNGLRPGTERHGLVRADVLRFLREAARGPARYDLAIVDPPTFSASSGMDRAFDLRRHHGELLGLVLRCVRPGGVVYFATARRSFRLEPEAVGEARVKDITRQTTPYDFRDRRPHHCYRIERT